MTARPPGPVRYKVSDRLVTLVERGGVAAGRLAGADAPALAAAADDAGRRQARASARLDGSPLEDDTAAAVDRDRAAGRPHGRPEGRPDGRAATGPARDGWAEALRIDRVPTQDAAAVEYDNLRAAVDIEAEVADAFFDEPLHVMTRLHAVLCRGLVADDAVARIRSTERAIHDGTQGKMLWAAPPPDRLPELLDALLEWLGDRSATVPTLVVAAVVHERLLEWQPFEAANGRLARAVSRVVRRARGLDPHGLAVPEEHWSTATLAYHGEVAATIRRRGDLTRWVERTVHVEVDALERAAAVLAPGSPPSVPPPVVELVAAVGAGGTLTDAEAAGRLGVSRERAVAGLERARRAGLVDDDLTVPVRRWRVVTPRD